MKYEKFIKIAVGTVAVATLFVLPTMALANALVAPTITSVAGDNLINAVEKATPGFPVIFNMTSTGTTSANSWITVNLANAGNANSATNTLVLGSAATSSTITIVPNTNLAEGAATVSLWWSDGIATTTVATKAATVDTTAPTIASTTILSNNSSTTLAKAGNTITLFATSSEAISTPLINFTFNGVASASTSVVTVLTAGTAFKATVAASTTDTSGVVGFSISSFSDTAGNPTATSSTTLKPATGTGVTFDTTVPTVSSVVWTDGPDADTNISAGDTIAITFSEPMATTTATSTNIDTVLGLSGTHSFGTSPTATWTGLTLLTITLGTGTTVASGDTIAPTSAVTDASGNGFTSVATTTITDNEGPVTPVNSFPAGTYVSTKSTNLSSVGSSNVYYTLDGTTPTCSFGNLYAGPITIDRSFTLKAVGCDAYSNISSVLSADYVISGSRSHSGGGGYSYVAPPLAPIVLPTIATVSPKALSMRLSRDLSVGSTGDDVVALQTFLETSGYLVMPNGVAKGYFGGLTKKAVVQFQKDKGLPQVGRVGPMTRGILNQGW